MAQARLRGAGSGYRRWLIAVAVVVLLAVVTVSILSVFYVDLLWFRSVHFSGVFWTILRTKIALGFIFGLLFFVLLFVNLVIVRRSAPSYRVVSPEQEMFERYRLAFEPYLKWLLPAFCLFLALIVGVGASKGWQTFLLWRNSSGIYFRSSTGPITDPLFHRNVSYYVFDLPFLRFVQGWLYSTLFGIAVITAIAHYLWGGIRPQSAGEKVTPQVKAHISVLLGLIVLAKAWGYYLGRFDLLQSTRGRVYGASYTDVHAQLPALRILAVVAVVCAVLFLVNIRLRGWALPVIGVGLLALTSVVVGGIIPTAVQQFSVKPQELQREEPYIARNIAYTRLAFGLNTISTSQPQIQPDLTPSDINNNQATISNIRLWDPALLKSDYEQLQRIWQYYEFQDVDVDRYYLNGQERLVMLSAREISQNGIPSGGGTWQNQHLVYTHGYGVAASQVNAANSQGGPLFLLSDIPPTGNPQVPGSQAIADQLNGPNGQPRIYYGERSDVPFVVVHTGAKELDYQGTTSGAQNQQYYSYQGTGGIPIGGFFTRLLFAWRYQDINLLISSLIHPDSRIMIYRSISQSVPRVAPFLQFDGDPYAAVVNGRVVWIWDAYTTTNMYPYSQELNLGSATGGALQGQANYIRNSVKVVVDAYNGSITYYVTDPTDPIIQVWERAFPGMFKPMSQAPAALVAHFRYPENLFQVQAEQYANYHVTDPSVFYGKGDFWAIPTDPANSANNPNSSSPLRPYYVQMLLPDATQEEFALIMPFTPQGRQNMVAWMAAKSDPQNYGQIVNYTFPAGQNVDGPTQVFNLINSFPEFSQERTLLGTGGSKILFGNFLVIPIGQSFLYVQPVFVQSSQANAFPELKRVVVVHGGEVGLGSTLQEAIDNSFGGAITPSQGGGKPPLGTGEKQVQALLQQALAHFNNAQAALQAGDLGTYQTEIDKAKQLVQQAQQLEATILTGKGGGAPVVVPSPVLPSVVASPTP